MRGGRRKTAHVRAGALLNQRGSEFLPVSHWGTHRPRRVSPPDPLRPAWLACRLTSAMPNAVRTPSASPLPKWGSGAPAPRPGHPRSAHGWMALPARHARLTPRAASAAASGDHTVRMLHPATPSLAWVPLELLSPRARLLGAVPAGRWAWPAGHVPLPGLPRELGVGWTSWRGRAS